MHRLCCWDLSIPDGPKYVFHVFVRLHPGGHHVHGHAMLDGHLLFHGQFTVHQLRCGQVCQRSKCNCVHALCRGHVSSERGAGVVHGVPARQVFELDGVLHVC